jgi:hypothetical protein
LAGRHAPLAKAASGFGFYEEDFLSASVVNDRCCGGWKELDCFAALAMTGRDGAMVGIIRFHPFFPWAGANK